MRWREEKKKKKGEQKGKVAAREKMVGREAAA